MKTTFYHCNVCGNIMAAVVPSGVIPFCCKEEMEAMEANSTEGKVDYHIPVVERIDECTIKVKVGKEPHPMTQEHHISFIVVETCDGAMIKYIDKCQKPEAEFLCKEEPQAVYAFCNLHGLWRCKCKCKENANQDKCSQ